MKKVLLVAFVAGLAMTSCKKEYTCECKSSSTYPGYTATTTSGTTGKMKKDEAESKCNQGDMSLQSIDPETFEFYTIKWDCNIK